jgi:hypothetical protein
MNRIPTLKLSQKWPDLYPDNKYWIGANPMSSGLTHPDGLGRCELIGDILTGHVEDRAPTPEEEGKDPAAVRRGRLGDATGATWGASGGTTTPPAPRRSAPESLSWRPYRVFGHIRRELFYPKPRREKAPR